MSFPSLTGGIVLVQHESGDIRLMEQGRSSYATAIAQHESIIHAPTLWEVIMAKFVSSRNPVSARALKRRPTGAVVVHHNGAWEDVRFTRVHGGWLRERTDFTGLSPVVVSSTAVARECNTAMGCAESWAKVY